MVVATDEFESLGRLECKARGMPDLRFVVTRHPIGGLKPEQVAAKAEAMVAGTLRAVTAEAMVESAGRSGAAP